MIEVKGKNGNIFVWKLLERTAGAKLCSYNR